MPASRQYDTVAFDVRDNATMLFFAQTTAAGDIEDYLLLMRSENEELDGAIFLEINEKQFAGSEMISEARMNGNMLTLIFHAPVTELENITELALIFDDTAENRTSMEAGAFRVLGEKLSGGNACPPPALACLLIVSTWFGVGMVAYTRVSQPMLHDD